MTLEINLHELTANFNTILETDRMETGVKLFQIMPLRWEIFLHWDVFKGQHVMKINWMNFVLDYFDIKGRKIS
jgi:hypothetical protein